MINPFDTREPRLELNVIPDYQISTTLYIKNSLLSKINESIEWIKFGKIGNDQARNMTKD